MDRIGEPEDSVVDSFGRSHEVTNLFVCDASVFPSSLGAPPEITVAALADRIARHIQESWRATMAG